MTMYTFEAVVADITGSATGMSSAAEAVGAADPTADLSSVGKALKGSVSGPAATSLTAAWTTRFSTWSTAAEQHATARRGSADAYTRADHEAAQRMQREAFANRGPAMHRDQ